jgi:hypothetical protein
MDGAPFLAQRTPPQQRGMSGQQACIKRCQFGGKWDGHIQGCVRDVSVEFLDIAHKCSVTLVHVQHQLGRLPGQSWDWLGGRRRLTAHRVVLMRAVSPALRQRGRNIFAWCEHNEAHELLESVSIQWRGYGR